MGSSCRCPWFKDRLLGLALRPSPVGLQRDFPDSFPKPHPCSRLQGTLGIFQPSLHSHGCRSNGMLCQDASPPLVYLVHSGPSTKGQFSCDLCFPLKRKKHGSLLCLYSALSTPRPSSPLSCSELIVHL